MFTFLKPFCRFRPVLNIHAKNGWFSVAVFAHIDSFNNYTRLISFTWRGSHLQPHCSGKDLLPNERNGNLNFLGIRLRTRSFILIASFRVNPYAGSDSPMHTWTYNSKNRLNDTKSNRFDVIWNGNDIFSCFSSCNSCKMVIRQILIF